MLTVEMTKLKLREVSHSPVTQLVSEWCRQRLLSCPSDPKPAFCPGPPASLTLVFTADGKVSLLNKGINEMRKFYFPSDFISLREIYVPGLYFMGPFYEQPDLWVVISRDRAGFLSRVYSFPANRDNGSGKSWSSESPSVPTELTLGGEWDRISIRRVAQEIGGSGSIFGEGRP